MAATPTATQRRRTSVAALARKSTLYSLASLQSTRDIFGLGCVQEEQRQTRRLPDGIASKLKLKLESLPRPRNLDEILAKTSPTRSARLREIQSRCRWLDAVRSSVPAAAGGALTP